MNTTRGRWVMAFVAAAALAPGAWLHAGDLEDGIDLYKQGKFAEAEAKLRQAEGTDAKAYLAASLAKQKKYGEAEGLAKAVLDDKDHATHEVAIAAVGEALVNLKKYDEAVTRLSAALEKKGDLAYAYFWRAQAYDKKGQSSRMVADYEQFVKLAPKAPEAATVQALLGALH